MGQVLAGGRRVAEGDSPCDAAVRACTSFHSARAAARQDRVKFLNVDDVHRQDGPLTPEHIRRGLPHRIGIGLRSLGTGSQGVPPLYPGEDEALGPRAVSQRRMLYALGRACGRDALAEVGLAPVPIGRGGGGEPLWPDGIVGAISHTSSIVAAVVASRTDYAGLGVDVEALDRGVDVRIARLVARPTEMAWVNPEAGPDRVIMLFSAKEAMFKALYPREQVWFGFADAELTWRPDRQAFEAELLKDLGDSYRVGFRMEVRCTLGSTWVASMAFVPAR
jgi:4'-phosphopantetheinyl transferase EntD